jgi:hypothetical protein
MKGLRFPSATGGCLVAEIITPCLLVVSDIAVKFVLPFGLGRTVEP